MELKFRSNVVKNGKTTVLIVPLWNWNNKKAFYFVKNARSNRTFMELKCDNCRQQDTQFLLVLIVPLWNWNEIDWISVANLTCSNRTFMELKFLDFWIGKGVASVLIVPLWNWNKVERGFTKWKTRVLIVPLWNWNVGLLLAFLGLQRSNRTFMELKFRG